MLAPGSLPINDMKKIKYHCVVQKMSIFTRQTLRAGFGEDGGV